MNFEKYSNIIKDSINLQTSPVGVKFFKNENEAKKILEKTDKTIHCQAIIDASNGEMFYGGVNEIGCPIGCQILGLKKLEDDILDGSRFNKMNVTKTQQGGKHLIDNVYKMDEKIEAIGYSPLETTPFEPDIIVIIAKARQIFNIIRAHTYNNGERLKSSVSGTQSLCGDIVVNTYKTNSLNISYGCIGSHMATDLGDNETIIGIPTSKIEDICESLEITKIERLS